MSTVADYCRMQGLQEARPLGEISLLRIESIVLYVIETKELENICSISVMDSRDQVTITAMI